MQFTDKQISDLLDGIFDGSITEYDLPLDYYEAVVNYLKKGLYKGFGMDLEQASGKDLDLLTELRENIYLFAAAKDYQMMKDLGTLLIDDNGELRSQSEFNDLARTQYDVWNDDWGKTEYNTAIGNGQMASKWNEIEKNKDLLPTLQYSTIGDACDICEPLDGFTAPVDDPVWDDIYPLNHFNCECTVLQLDDLGDPGTGEDVTDLMIITNKKNIIADVLKLMNPVFKNNSGKSGEIFKKDHPYFDVPKEDKEYAKRNFDLPIPDKDE